MGFQLDCRLIDLISYSCQVFVLLYSQRTQLLENRQFLTMFTIAHVNSPCPSVLKTFCICYVLRVINLKVCNDCAASPVLIHLVTFYVIHFMSAMTI